MPDVGFPQMVESDSELEGIYRLLGNEEVKADAVLAPHIAAALRARANEQSRAVSAVPHGA